MKCLIAISMAATALLFPYERAVGFIHEDWEDPVAPVPVVAENNVNTRYKIESVGMRNWRGFVSRSLDREMRRLEGKAFRVALVDAVEKRIKSEFPGYSVARNVEKGTRPQHVKVLFDLERNRKVIDLSTPRMLYATNSKGSLGADANVETRYANFSLGLITDNDERLERFTGFRGGVVVPIGRGRVRVGLLGESYRAQWDVQTRERGEIYRTRSNIEPSVIIDVAPGLELRAGLSFNELEMQVPAARDQAANALFTTLRYSRQWQLGLTGTKTLEAGYDLRAAASSLGSDYSYRRHTGEARFTLAASDLGPDGASVSVSALVGGIDGQAPLLDRFVLGNSRTLRGWSRFDLAPLGGGRMAHLSVDGRYRYLRLCYDSGTIWDEGRPKILRHSAGVGLTVQGMTAMVAFPLRGGSIEPVFLVGMNF